MSEKDDRKNVSTDTEENLPVTQISNFAAKLGEDTHGEYVVYVYRKEIDEKDGTERKNLVHKYKSEEPDPFDIAQRFKGGRYSIAFVWYIKGEQKTKTFTLDVDPIVFPPLQKQNTTIMPYANDPNLSDQMKMNLVFITSVTEVLKSAYAGGGNHQVLQQDPLAAFEGMLTTMENSYKKAMAIQSTIYERVFARGLEERFGLTPDGGAAMPVEETGEIGKYGGIIRDIVGGLKDVVEMFGMVPPKVAEKVKKDARFQELLKDRKAIETIGAALRKEFGDDKAKGYMRQFGVEMVIKKPARIARTPDIPGTNGKNVPGSVKPARIEQTAPGATSTPSQGKQGTAGKGKGKEEKVKTG